MPPYEESSTRGRGGLRKQAKPKLDGLPIGTQFNDLPSSHIPTSDLQSPTERGWTSNISIPPSPSSPHHRSEKKGSRLAPSSLPSSLSKSPLVSISKSMGDLFGRGKGSPPNRDPSPRRLGPVSERHPSGSEIPSMSRRNTGDSSTQPSGFQVLKESWVNVVDTHGASKKGSLKDAWRLHLAIIVGTQMYLYKAPSQQMPYKSFDIDIAPLPSLLARPKTAPALQTVASSITTPSESSSSQHDVSSSKGLIQTTNLKHMSPMPHPELRVSEDNEIVGGTIESICHEIIFGEDEDFVRSALFMLIAWCGLATPALHMSEYAKIQDASERIGLIIKLVVESCFGMLLEPGNQQACLDLIESVVEDSRREALRNKVINIEETLRDRLHLDGVDSAEAERDPTSLPPLFGELSLFLTADEFLSIGPEQFATQLHLYHLSVLEAWNPEFDISLLLASPLSPPPLYRNPLIFTPNSSHFLTERIISHLLTGQAASDITYRSKILSQWIDTAALLRDKGDMAGWFAITVSLLSPAILRLKETWSKVDPDYLRLLSKWSYFFFQILYQKFHGGRDSSKRHVYARSDGPQTDGVPYYGNLCYFMTDDQFGSEERSMNLVRFTRGLLHIEDSISRFKEHVAKAASAGTFFSRVNDGRTIPGVRRMLRELNKNNQDPPSIFSPEFFAMSLSCEPGMPNSTIIFYQQDQLPLISGANVPLLFTESFPRYSLFDRRDLLANVAKVHKKVSSSGLSSNRYAEDNDPANLRRTNSFPPVAGMTGLRDLDASTQFKTNVLESKNSELIRSIRDVLGVRQTYFWARDGELVLKSMESDDKTRKSRPTSFIETAGNRMSFPARRISGHFAADSPRNSVHEHSRQNRVESPKSPRKVSGGLETMLLNELDAPPKTVVCKGATLERLVDILVLGVEDFSGRVGADGNQLHMDMNEYSEVFFSTYRSFISPEMLMEYLRKRMKGSRSAAMFIDSPSDDVVFPWWSGQEDPLSNQIDWKLLARIHLGIIDALLVWIDGFFVDFYSDVNLRERLAQFLVLVTKELRSWQDVQDNDPRYEDAKAIIDLYEEFKKTFASKSVLPALNPTADDGLFTPISIPIRRSRQTELANFVERLEVTVQHYFRLVDPMDWQVVVENLEVQSAGPLGFFASKDAVNQLESSGQLQDVFFMLKNVRRDTGDLLFDSFPRAVQNLCNLHADMKKWFWCQMSAPGIPYDERVYTIQDVLKILALCRYRMHALDLTDSDGQSLSNVPSFVGSAIAAACMRPEPRMFSMSWLKAAELIKGPKATLYNLADIIPDVTEPELTYKKTPMMPCVGWVIERLLEVICSVPNMQPDTENRLINFDKRRYLFNVLNNFTRVDEDSLLDPSKTPMVSFDIPIEPSKKDIRTWAEQENQYSKAGRISVFGSLFQQEHEKIRRDNKSRDLIERIERDKLKRREKMGHVSSHRPPADLGERRLGVKKLGVFVKSGIRPISMAVSSSWSSPVQHSRSISPAQLPPTSIIDGQRRAKPTSIIDLTNISSLVCRNSKERPRCYFTLRHKEHGAAYWVQAMNPSDLDDYLRIISSIRGIKVQTEAPSVLEDIKLFSKVAQPVFGVSLQELCRRDKRKLPLVVDYLLDIIEERGLDSEGIWRISGSVRERDEIKVLLDSGENVDPARYPDVNTWVSVFKLWHRELPNLIFTSDVKEKMQWALFRARRPIDEKPRAKKPDYGDGYAHVPGEEDDESGWDRNVGDEKTKIKQMYQDRERRKRAEGGEEETLSQLDEHAPLIVARRISDPVKVVRLRQIVLSMPDAHYHFLRRLFIHLNQVHQLHNLNKMPASNLSVIFMMSLGSDFQQFANSVLQTMILWATEVFPPTPDDDEVAESLLEQEEYETVQQPLRVHQPSSREHSYHHGGPNSPAMSSGPHSPIGGYHGSGDEVLHSPVSSVTNDEGDSDDLEEYEAGPKPEPKGRPRPMRIGTAVSH